MGNRQSFNDLPGLLEMTETLSENSAIPEQLQEEEGNNFGGVTFSGMHNHPPLEHTYSRVQLPVPYGMASYIGAPATAATGTSMFYPYQYLQVQQQQSLYGSSYYPLTLFNESLILGKLLQHLNVLPLAGLNSEFDPNRGATTVELNKLTLKFNKSQLKLADAIVLMIMTMRELEKDLSKQNTKIEILEKRIAEFEELRRIELTKSAKQGSENLTSNVEEKSGDIDEAGNQTSAIIGEMSIELNCNILQIKNDIRSKQYFPFVERQEKCTSSFSCCVKCCSFKTQPTPVAAYPYPAMRNLPFTVNSPFYTNTYARW